MMLNQTVLIQNRVRLSNLLILDINENSKSSPISNDFTLETDIIEFGINQSWSQAVLFYGFLVSVMQLGIAIESFLEGTIGLDISVSSSKSSKIGAGMTGKGINQRSHSYCTQLCLHQCLMCCSYFGACFVSRLSVLLLFVFALGFSSGRCLSLSFSSAPTSQTAFQSSNQTHFGRSREILLAIFTFVSLASGFLYSPPDAILAAEVLTSPLRYNAFFVFIITCVSVAYHCCLPRILNSASRMPLNDRRKIQLDRRSSAGSIEESQRPDDDDERDEATNYTIPANFLSTCRGDEKKARTMYAKMLRWRHDHNLDTILTRQQSSSHVFHSILRYYPHFIHGYSLDDCAVVYEILGQGDPHRLKEAGVTMEQLVWHFVVRNELVFKLLQERSTREVRTAPADGVLRMMTVLDVKGIGIGSVTADVLSFIGKSGEIIDNYYPEQVKRLVIVNTPRWFSTIWLGIARVLPESVKRKVDILSNVSQLDKYIDPSQQPALYGGRGVDLGKADGHLAFLQLVRDWAENSEREQSDRNSKSNTSTTLATSTGIGRLSSTEKDGTSVSYRAVDISKPQQVKEKDVGGSPSGNKRNSGGFLGWLVGSSSESSQPNPAFLGSKNQYRFNSATQSWHLDFSLCEDNVSDSGAQKENSNPSYENEVEEQQLVLAIQAAHLASGLGKMGNFSGSCCSSSSSSERSSPSSSPYRSSTFYSNSFDEVLTTESSRNSSSSSSMSTRKPSAHVFLLVCAIYTVTSTIQSAVWTLLPVWLVSSRRSGGVGLSIQDLTLCLSGCALLTLNVHFLLHRRCQQILQSSPLRTLRIGSGLLIIVMLMLHPTHQLLSARLHSNPNIGHPSSYPHMSSSNSYFFLPAEHLFLDSNPNLNPNPAADYSFFISISVLATMLSAAVCSGHLVVAAAGGLLQVVLTSSFTSSSSIRLILRAICSIIGSMGAVTGYSTVLGLRLRHPMDSGCFLYICAWVILSVYISTVFLAVHFRGDYGLISDSDDLLTGMYSDDRVDDSIEGGMRYSRRGTETRFSSIHSTRSSSTSCWCFGGLITALVSIPGGDLSLLASLLTSASSSSSIGGVGVPKRQYFFKKEEFKEM